MRTVLECLWNNVHDTIFSIYVVLSREKSAKSHLNGIIGSEVRTECTSRVCFRDVPLGHPSRDVPVRP
jgi:hypothetical protein